MSSWEERFPKLWAFGEQLAIVVLGGLMFWLFSALIITAPAAFAALFAATAGFVRPVQGEVLGRFWRGFRRSFWTALGLGAIDVAVAGILWVDIKFFRAINPTMGFVAYVIFGSVGLVLALANMYAWPLLAWYPQPLKKLLKRSLLLAVGHPFHALGGLLLAAGVLLAMAMLPGWAGAFLPLLGPGIAAIIIGKMVWLAMRRYAGEEDEFAE